MQTNTPKQSSAGTASQSSEPSRYASATAPATTEPRRCRTVSCGRAWRAVAGNWLQALPILGAMLVVILVGECQPNLAHGRVIFILSALAMVGGVAVMRCAMGRQSLAETIFVVAVMLITIGIMLDANMFSTGQGYSDSFPLLINEDAYRSWINANAFYEGNWRTAPLVWNLYGAILAITFIPFGPSIAMALTVSMIAGAVTLLLTTLTAWRLTRSRVVATAALGATAMVAYLMVSSTIRLKDIWVVIFLKS